MFFGNSTSRSEDYAELCEKLDYSFKSKQLLKQALTRTTAINEGLGRGAQDDNQRLEFVGDKVIGTVISTILFEQHPDWREGRLTCVTSQLVNNSILWFA